MGIVAVSHKKLFEAIHNNHKKFGSIEDLANWYAKNIRNRDEIIKIMRYLVSKEAKEMGLL